jgi:hypothetical protein
MTDPFEDFANEHQSRYSKRREKTRAERRIEKELAERDYLFEEWTQWHQKRKQELLTGVHAEMANELAGFLERMTINDAPALVTLVRSRPWHMTDPDTRFLALELISHAIIYLRERAELPPFDDPIPWSDDEPDAFMIIKRLLR